MKANRVIADFRIEGATEMHEKLAAVASAHIEAAAYGTHGVLVTRLDFDSLSVALSHEVPAVACTPEAGALARPGAGMR